MGVGPLKSWLSIMPLDVSTFKQCVNKAVIWFSSQDIKSTKWNISDSNNKNIYTSKAYVAFLSHTFKLTEQ